MPLVPFIPLIAAGVGAAATVYATSKQSKAVSQATQAQTASNDQALNLQNQQYQQQRSDYAPWRNIGVSALQQLARVHGFADPTAGSTYASTPVPNAGGTPSAGAQTITLPNGQTINIPGQVIHHALGNDSDAPATALTNSGLQPGTAPAATTGTPAATTPGVGVGGTPDYSGFYTSPDYNFRRNESIRAVTGNYAARGLLDSGQGLGEGLLATASGLASTEYGNWYNRIAALAGVGQTATDSTTQAAQAARNAQTNILQNQGNNLASSYLSQGQIQSGLISNLGGIASGLISNIPGGTRTNAASVASSPYVQSVIPGGQYSNPGLIPNQLYGAVI